MKAIQEKITMNMNEIAYKISKLEKGEKQTDIAQIKEVLRCLAVVMANHESACDSVLKYAERIKQRIK